MKYLILLPIILLSACTRTVGLDHGRWSGSGEMPKLDAQGISSAESVHSQGEKLEFSEQSLGSFRVEGAYLKKISRQGRSVFLSYAVIRNPQQGSLLKQAERLKERMDLLWRKFLSQDSDLKSMKLFEAPQVIIAGGEQAEPVIRAVFEKKTGELIEIHLSKKGKLIREKFLGSAIDLSPVSTLVFPKGPKNSDLSQAFVLRLLTPEGLRNNLVNVNTDGPAKILNTSALEIQPSDERFDQTQAFYFASQILKWFGAKNIFTDPFNLKITTQVGYPERTNTAFYFQGRIRLGTGDDVTYTKIPWDPSIVMHEVSHAVIERLARLPTDGEGGSLNEGFADFFTSFALGTAHMGESSFKPGAYRRTVETVMKLSERNGGLYHDSAVVSGLFWSMKTIVSDDKIISLAVRTLNRLGPDADFNKFQESLVEQSQEIFQDEELAKVQQIFREREIL